MRFLIVGVGAVGSVFLSFLSRKGYHCLGLVKKGKIIDTIQVEGIWGEFKQSVLTVDNPADVPFDPDVVILSVRSYDTRSALEGIRGIFKRGAYLLIAQNGYGNYETAVEILGEGRVILSRVIFGAKLLGVGRVRITVCADDVVIGDPSSTIDTSFLEGLATQIRDSGIPTRYDKDVYKHLTDKVIYNSALNPLGALFETTYGNLAKNPFTREVMDKVIEEAFEVIKAHSIPTFHSDAESYKKLFYEKLLPSTAQHVPSMLDDVRKGKTEIDSLNGAIVELAKRAGLSVPTNELIVKLTKAKEHFNHTRIQQGSL